MMERLRRPLAGASMVAGVLLGLVSAGPLSWGLGVVVSIVLMVGGWSVLTDRRPPRTTPYDRERYSRGMD